MTRGHHKRLTPEQQAALAAIEGRHGWLRVRPDQTGGEALWLPVQVVACRMVVGRVQCRVAPVGGAGRQWVGLERLRWEKPEREIPGSD